MATISQRQLAKWYEAHGAELMLYARQWSPDQQAEDIVQDAFIKLLKQRRCPDNVRAWLFRVVRNSSINIARRRRRREERKRFLRRQSLWFESRPDDLIDGRIAQEVMQTLPAHLREIVLLRIWGQMSLREISHIVNKSIPWIHNNYRMALEIIRKKLEHSSCTKKKA